MAETLISPGVLTRENDISFIQPQAAAVGAAFIGPTVKGPVEQPTVVTSYGQYQRLFGTTIQSGSNNYEYLTSIAVKSYFEQGGSTALITRVVSGSYTAADNTTITTVGASVTNPFQLETIGKGTIYNNATGSAHNTAAHNADGSITLGKADNIRFEITNVNHNSGTFSLLVRRGDDSRKNKIILETFNDLSLDPNSENYIERVIGNQAVSKTTEGSEVFVSVTGEYANKSNYIRVAAVNNPTLNYLANDGVTVNSLNGVSLSGSLPVAQSGSFYNATGTAFPTGKVAKFFKNISNTDTQGLVATNYADAISILNNKDEYQFNIVAAPGLIYDFGTHKTQLDSIISLVEGRGDAIAVVDLEQYGATVSNVTAAAGTVNSSYAAAYWPWLQTQSATGKNEWVPASTVIPGVYAFTDSAAAPWFAPAGLVKGGIPNVIQAERKVSREQRDLLYRANVNPIATFPGQGIAVYGQKTLQKKASALDRVNVRRLLIELKRFIGGQANNLVFEQNTIATRNKFLAIVNPYLESVVQRQGLYAYRVVMDDSNNTADIVDRNQIVGQIFIQPAKTAEFVVLDFTIEPTGATFVA